MNWITRKFATRLLLALSLVWFSGAAYAQDFAPDGYQKAQPSYIRNAATGLYLHQEGRSVALRPLVPNDDSFMWIEHGANLDEGYELFSISTGLVLYGDVGGAGLAARSTSRNVWRTYRDWRKPDVHTMVLSQKVFEQDAAGNSTSISIIGLASSGENVVVQADPGPKDNRSLWTFEPAPRRDLAVVNFYRVRAVQTSTGTDGSTDALFKGLELAAEWGPSLAKSGVLTAVKKVVVAGGSAVARTSLREIAKSAARKVIGSVAKKSGPSKFAKVWKATKSTAANSAKKLKTKLVKKQTTYTSYMGNPRRGFTLKNLIKTVKRSNSIKGQIEKFDEREKQIDNLAKALGIGTSAAQSNVTPEQLAAVDAAADDESTNLTQNLVNVFAAYDAAETTPSVIEDQRLCALDTPLHEPNEAPTRDGIITAENLAGFSEAAKEIQEAVTAAQAEPLEMDAATLVTDTLLMNPGFIKNMLNPLIVDTDDQLKIYINGEQVWPGGGDGHQDISKKESLPVGVTFIFDRQKGININLVEWDYGSKDDDMGSLIFDTKNLTDREAYKDTFIAQKSEGSLYTVDFAVRSLNGKHQMDVLADQSKAACDREAARAEAVEKAEVDFQQAIFDLAQRTERRKQVLAKFGPDGLTVIDEALKFQEILDASCTGSPLDYANLLDGNWRVGGYTKLLDKDRTRTWTYAFTANGKVTAPNYFGTWSAKPAVGSTKNCGIYLNLTAHEGASAIGEVFVPIRQEGSQIVAYHSAADYPGSHFADEVHAFAHTLDSKNTQANIVLANSGGPRFWLEKMPDLKANPKESLEAIQDAKNDLIGNWDVKTLHSIRTWAGRPDTFGFPHDVAREWLFTSDGHVMMLDSVFMFASTGTWSYIGDRRFSVKMADEIHLKNEKAWGDYLGNISREAPGAEFESQFTIYLNDLEAEKSEFHTHLEQNARYLLGGRSASAVTYTKITDQAQLDLENLRLKLRQKTPEDEVKANPLSLTQLREQREAYIVENRERLVARLETLRVEKNRNINIESRRQNIPVCTAEIGMDNLWPYQADAIGNVGHRANLVGDWQVFVSDSRGGSIVGTETIWSFAPDGSVSGKLGNKKWAGNWTAQSGCIGTLVLDAATANLLNVDTELEIKLGVKETGDKEIFFVEKQHQASVLRGHHYTDRSVFAYKFNKIQFTPGQLANRCSTRQPDAALLARKESLFTDFYATTGRPEWDAKEADKDRLTGAVLDIFRVDFNAANATRIGQVPVGKVTSFPGMRGEELVALGPDNQCVAVITSTQPVMERRKQFGTPTGGKLVTSVFYEEKLTPLQIERGCAEHRTVLSDHRNFTATRNESGQNGKNGWGLFNTGPSTLFAYEVADTGNSITQTAGVFSGAYETSEPVAVVKPGGVGLLQKNLTKYVILDEDNKCQAIVETGSVRYGYDFGEGETPIKDPDYLTPLQRQNGCWDIGVKGSYINGSPTGTTRLVSNTGRSDMSVSWSNYSGQMEPHAKLRSGETIKLNDYNDNYYAVFDAKDKCVAYKKMSDGDAELAWIFGDGKVDAQKTAKIIPPKRQNGVPQKPFNEIQIANGCEALGSRFSTPISRNSGTGGNKVTFINASASKMTLHWLSFYGYELNDQQTRKPAPMAELLSASKLNKEEDQRRSLSIQENRFRSGLSGYDAFKASFTYLSSIGDVISVMDEDGQCVGVFEIQSPLSDYSLRSKVETDEISAKFASEREIKKAMADSIADLKKRQADSQCGPDGILSVEAVQGVWKTGAYGARGEKIRQVDRSMWAISERNGSSKRVSLNENPTPLSSGGARTVKPLDMLPLCVMQEFDGALTINVIVNKDGSKEFYTLNDDGNLDGWGELSPAISTISDIDQQPESISEAAKKGTLVGITALATDADDTVTYAIESDGPFAIDSKTGVVTLTGPLDREEHADHWINVAAQSADTSESFARFTVAVEDVNEASIGEISNVFEYGEVQLFEDAEIGKQVGITALASDADGGDAISYSLSSDAGGWFSIDAVSGEVSVAGSMDWETEPNPSIEIVATSSDGSSSTKRFAIPYLDSNEFDVGPVTDIDSSPNIVDENLPVGTQVGVTAFAEDGDGSAIVSYSLRGNPGWLAVDAKSGVVTIATPLDWEIESELTVEIRAESSDNSQSIASFVIQVRDVNEFDISEIIDADFQANQVDEGARSGTSVNVTAVARDGDGTDTVHYALSVDAGGMFSIDPESGIVTVAGQVHDAETIQFIEVTATSSDGSFSREWFDIAVNISNDTLISDVIDDDRAPNILEETAPVGALVGITAFATDADGSDSVSYSLSGRDAFLFAINPQTGVVTLSAELNHEVAAFHTFEINAASTDRSSSATTVEIVVTDVNEFPIRPTNDLDERNDEIAENAPYGTEIGITAFSEDLDPSDRVTYQLVDDADGRFAIDPDTGIVSLMGELDFETDTNHSIVIVATSSDGTSSELQTFITVLGVDEFDISAFADLDGAPNEVAENAEYGTRVGITVSATDGDFDSGRIDYALVDDAGNETFGNGAFEIDQLSGEIYVAHPELLRNAENGWHVVNVRAQSNDGSARVESFDVALILAQKWFNNPQGPRVEADFPKVTAEDHALCVAADDDPTSPVYNNENAFFDCLEGYRPPVINWQSAPQDPRGNDLPVYAKVSDVDWGKCVVANENQNGPDYNNEQAFYDCLDRFRDQADANAGAADNQNSQLQGQINACAASFDVFFETNGNTGAKMSVSNTGATRLNVYTVAGSDTSNGEPIPVATVDPDFSVDFDAMRQEGFAILGSDGACVGAIKAWESRNSKSVAQESQSNGAGQGGSTGAGAAPNPNRDLDYSDVPQAESNYCSNTYPDSPKDDDAYYSCMFDALTAVQQQGSSGGDTAQPANENDFENAQPDGWNRAEVYYQLAGDFCAGELGLDQNGQDYNDCYYAYPDYQPADKISNYCNSEYANDNQRQQCMSAIRECAVLHPDIESKDFENCAVNTGW